MLQIAAWLERHRVLGHLAGGVAVIGGTWLLVGWLQPARPDTPIAHVYCSIILRSCAGITRINVGVTETGRSGGVLADTVSPTP